MPKMLVSVLALLKIVQLIYINLIQSKTEDMEQNVFNDHSQYMYSFGVCFIFLKFYNRYILEVLVFNH